MSTAAPDAPAEILEYAGRAVDYVRRALGITLDYDSDTLPLLDHYLRGVPGDQPAMIELVIATAGAYFGEVVRRRLGGRWDAVSAGPQAWRVVLPTSISFSPAGMVAAAIAHAELDEVDTALDAPPRMRPHLEEALSRMGEVTEDEFFSLGGRLDTLEHVHEVLVGVAARLLGDAATDGEAGGETGGETDGDEPETAPS